MRTTLTMEIAGIISRGRHDDLTSTRIAYEIMDHLRREAKRSNRRPDKPPGTPQRVVTQEHLFKGL